MPKKDESPKHKRLVRELAKKFRKSYGYRVDAVDGVTESQPDLIENSSGVGDGQDKRPDVEGFDGKNQRFVLGEAKIGEGDIGSEHSITQYRLFSNLVWNGVDVWLYIIVPKNKKQRLNDIIVDNVPRKNWKKIEMVPSEVYTD